MLSTLLLLLIVRPLASEFSFWMPYLLAYVF
jgi:hypothetical protein